MVLIISVDKDLHKTFATYRAAVDAAFEVIRNTDSVTVIIAAVQGASHTKFSPVFLMRGDENREVYERLINAGFKVIQ